jgi:hypothetical protein
MNVQLMDIYKMQTKIFVINVIVLVKHVKKLNLSLNALPVIHHFIFIKINA